MSKKCLYYCSTCNVFFSGESSVLTQRCDNCNSVLLVAHDDYDVFSSLSEVQQKRFRQDYVSSHSSFSRSSSLSYDLPESTWVAILRTSGWFVVSVCIFLGIIIWLSTLASSPLLGLIVGSLIALAGVVAVSFSMVFCTIASDLRAIRNQLSSITHR